MSFLLELPNKQQQAGEKRHILIAGIFSTSYLGLRGEKGPAEAVHVTQVDLDAGVGKAQLMETGGVVTGTDVALARER